jgi:hypothetical protein
MSLRTRVESLLEQRGIGFVRTLDPDVLELSLDGDNGSFLSYIFVARPRRIITIRTLLPLKTPHDRRSLVAELLVRINVHLILGHFELTWHDGLIVCRTSIMLGTSKLHADLLRYSLDAGWWESDRWFPAMRAVVVGNLTPEQAMERITPQLRLDDPEDMGGWLLSHPLAIERAAAGGFRRQGTVVVLSDDDIPF